MLTSATRRSGPRIARGILAPAGLVREFRVEPSDQTLWWQNSALAPDGLTRRAGRPPQVAAKKSKGETPEKS